MNKNIKFFLYIIGFIGSSLLAIYLYIIFAPKNEVRIFKLENLSQKNEKVVLLNECSNINYKKYIDSNNVFDIKTLELQLNDFNKIDSNLNYQSEFFKYLSDSVFQIRSKLFLEYNPEFLNNVTFFAIELNNCSKLETKNKILYEALSQFWFQKISETLSNASKENNNIKKTDKFRYLITILGNYQYFPSVFVSDKEKVVKYIKENNWEYLFRRFYGGTSIWFKLLFFACPIILSFSIFYFIKKLKN
jgi:hypothetical protein